METCSNGRQAIEHARSSRPDLILMDVMMPVMSGFEALRAMRETPGLESVPVVLMSAVAPGVRREGYEWQSSLSKPFSLEGPVGAVERQIGGRALGRRGDEGQGRTGVNEETPPGRVVRPGGAVDPRPIPDRPGLAALPESIRADRDRSPILGGLAGYPGKSGREMSAGPIRRPGNLRVLPLASGESFRVGRRVLAMGGI